MPPPPESPTAWILLGKRRGDNNQAIALAEALGARIVEKPLRFTAWRFLPRRLAALALWTVDGETRRTLTPPWPALVIGVGKRCVPVARAIRALSGGATRIVMLGDPRSPPRWFDLVLTTPQYRVAPAPNVHVLPFPLPIGVAHHAIEEQTGPPTRVLLIGGPSWPWRPAVASVIAAARRCRALAEAEGGAVIALTGQRTPAAIRQALVDSLGAGAVDRIGYRAALAGGTQFYVTADSASMLGDAITTGRPVAMLPVAAGPVGRLWMALSRALFPDAPLWPRDLPRFWRAIRAAGLAGPADAPSAGAAPDVTMLAKVLVEPLLPAQARRSPARPT
ncbi:MAG TPA: ELM1/GtrOC1 family putative glycosyltransferase [Sphingomonas sp.]